LLPPRPRRSLWRLRPGLGLPPRRRAPLFSPAVASSLAPPTHKPQGGEKVGVVGRTGSGKSTLLLALYRMFNLESGSITVDNIDIATISLQQLRRALSVIPQEPVLFSGTVRANLDPFDDAGGDAALWEALRECGLAEQVKGAGGLDARLDATGGAAWSVGQQQLMCLARAYLKKARRPAPAAGVCLGSRTRATSVVS
jgi:ATP-binding cassette, subfamily C (CFTR/MRP), member 1